MKRMISIAVLTFSIVAPSASVAFAAAPSGATGHGAQVAALAHADTYVDGRAHGAAVSAFAKTHGHEVSAAARAKAAAAAAAGRAKGAAAAAAGKAHRP